MGQTGKRKRHATRCVAGSGAGQTDGQVSKHYFPHPSDAGGNNLFVRPNRKLAGWFIARKQFNFTSPTKDTKTCGIQMLPKIFPVTTIC